MKLDPTKIKLPEGWQVCPDGFYHESLDVVILRDAIALPYVSDNEIKWECTNILDSASEQAEFLRVYQEAMEIARKIREIGEVK